jgi:hypothetical protein
MTAVSQVLMGDHYLRISRDEDRGDADGRKDLGSVSETQGT